MIHRHTTVILIAFNEERTINDIIERTKLQGFDDIIVVDDGSIDRTRTFAQELGVKVISHMINRGAGAATQTGIDYALDHGAEYIVTLDSDGQHYPEDIETLLDGIISSGADMVIGNRFLSKKNSIPMTRKIMNRIGNYITFLFTGQYFEDSQSGFKILTRTAAKKIRLNTDGYEFCMEMIIKAVQNNLFIVNAPIAVMYSKTSMSKGQNLFTGISTALNMMVNFNFKRTETH